MNQKQFKEILRKNIIEIDYERKDGYRSFIYATLDFSIIPEKDHPLKKKKTGNGTAQEKSYITVYDIKDKKWKSLTWGKFLNMWSIEEKYSEKNMLIERLNILFDQKEVFEIAGDKYGFGEINKKQISAIEKEIAELSKKMLTFIS